jgi:hypothetical protein
VVESESGENTMTSIVEVPSLAHKAMLAKLSQTSLGDKKNEAGLTEQLQTAHNDRSLKVTATLFRDKNNPVWQVKQYQQEIYTYHTTHTLPFEDGGSRLLREDPRQDGPVEEGASGELLRLRESRHRVSPQ